MTEDNLNNKNNNEKETSPIYDVKELINEGYLYDNTGIYVPYTYKHENNPDPRKIYLKIHRNPNKNCELTYTWVAKQEDGFRNLTFFRNDKLINEKDTKFNRSLSFCGGQAGIDSCNGCYKRFSEDFKSKIILADCLEVFKKLDFEFPKYEEEIEEETETYEEVFSFDSYPKLIQDEALKIIKDDSLYEKYVDSISITHEGNRDAKEQLALISVSPFVGESIHVEINADSGKGKTDVTTETVKNIPDIYVHHLSTVSPKNIYYDRESYGAFNIVIFDDVILSDETIGLLKVLSDNNKPVKELKTVIDKKAVNFTLEGKFLVILTYAKDNPDKELLNRLYKLNIIIDNDDKSKIKTKIKTKTVIDAGHNEIISKFREIIQAAIQYLIEQKIEIFNPFAVLFNPNDLANRNIGHFITMVKCKSFFHTKKLKPIQFMGKTIYIGSYDDFEAVSKIWTKENDTQKYKLNSHQQKILEILDEKTRDEAIENIEKTLEKYTNAESKEKANILDEQFTRKTISKLIGVSETTVRNYLDRSQGTAPSLVDMELVGKIRFNAEQNNSPWVYYKNKKSDDETEKTAWQDWRIENAKHFDTLNCKIRILLSLLYLANITVNEKGYAFLKKYCESKNHYIDLNDYNSYYNFINDAINNFNFDEYAVELEDATLSDLTYMIEQFESLNQEGEKNKGDPPDKNSAGFAKQPKSGESAQNADSTPVSYGKQDLPSPAKQRDNNELFSLDVNNPNYAAKICELLVHQDLTREAIFSELHPDVLLDQDFVLFYLEEFSETIDDLYKKGYISIIESDDGISYYHLNDDLKNKLN